ncbi:DNA polymerase III subunit chi [Pleionea sediminis]|uniref:DNA polymerase III subunit chi n=1 Tax=Pleionea sediminis TaxID=2569479 RepID=UPI001184A814|nr:DNA polymerase III subunit chi [Pleionea sediminis]
MTQVEFYIIEDDKPKSAFRRSIALIQNAYSQKKRIFIHTGSRRDAEHIDELLWTQEPSSFLPHLMSGEADGINPPIEIGYGQLPNVRPDVLINLSDNVPEFHGQFEKVIEFAHGDDEQKEKARARFKFYRDRGYPLKHFNLNN